MYTVNKYPDGSSYVETDRSEQEVIRLNSYEDLWTLNQLVDAKTSLGIRVTITIPRLIDAQADRRFRENQSSGLLLVMNLLSGLNANFKIFHPHNAEVVEALGSNVEIIDNSDFLDPILKLHLRLTREGDRVILDNNIDRPKRGLLALMSPDAGAYKQLFKVVEKINFRDNVYSASKARSYDGKIVQILEKADFGGENIVIVDDICVGGRTFIGLAKKLRAANCGKLILVVSHMVHQVVSKELNEAFDYIYTTNSIHKKYLLDDSEGGTTVNSRVITCGLFGDTLIKTAGHRG